MGDFSKISITPFPTATPEWGFSSADRTLFAEQQQQQVVWLEHNDPILISAFSGVRLALGIYT